MPLYQYGIDTVKSDISKAVRHALNTDAWTSASMDSYITTTCHYINPASFELQSNVLDTKFASFNHTAENLAVIMLLTLFWHVKKDTWLFYSYTKPGSKKL